MIRVSRRTLAATIVLGLSLVPTTLLAQNADIESMVEQIFMNRPDEPFVSVVVRDAAQWEYLAFHISTYLDVKELRVYIIPFKSTDAEAIDAALAAGEHEVAFQQLIAEMRLDLGARYVSDAGLNGVNDQPVALGSGSLRDNFHREQFGTYEAADKAYRTWLERAVALVES